MKTILFFVAITSCCLFSSPVNAQATTPEPLGLPGDNLNLYGVLDLFQKSPTLEEFEKKLNSEESKVNNLDLNGNNMIDYINVKDNVNGDAHAIVLQVAVSESEMQDVAVIQVEKNKDGNIFIQIIGNEQLYGKDYIIEPNDQAKNNNSGGTPNPGYKGNTTVVTNNYYTNNYNNGGYSYYANDWGIVRFIFSAVYVVWISPYYWGFYPSYWYTWTPYYWHSYAYYHHYHCGYYYNNYCRSNIYRNTNCNTAYQTCRRTSESVKNNVDKGRYNDTYSKPHLASKEGTSPKGNQLSHSTFDNSRVDKAGPRVSDENTKEISNGNSGRENGSSNNSGTSARENNSRPSNENSSSGNNTYTNSRPSKESSSSGNSTYSNSRPSKGSSSSSNDSYSNSRPSNSSGNSSGSGRHKGSYSRGSSGGNSSSGSHSTSRGSGGYKSSGSHSNSRGSGGSKPSGSSRSGGGGSHGGSKSGVGGRR